MYRSSPWRLVLPAAARVLKNDGRCVCLIKPQFEAGRERVGKGGVVRDSKVHRDVLRAVLGAAERNGFTPRRLVASPITGPAGNVEFLALLARDDETSADSASLIDSAMEEARELISAG